MVETVTDRAFNIYTKNVIEMLEKIPLAKNNWVPYRDAFRQLTFLASKAVLVKYAADQDTELSMEDENVLPIVFDSTDTNFQVMVQQIFEEDPRKNPFDEFGNLMIYSFPMGERNVQMTEQIQQDAIMMPVKREPRNRNLEMSNNDLASFKVNLDLTLGQNDGIVDIRQQLADINIEMKKSKMAMKDRDEKMADILRETAGLNARMDKVIKKFGDAQKIADKAFISVTEMRKQLEIAEKENVNEKMMLGGTIKAISEDLQVTIKSVDMLKKVKKEKGVKSKDVMEEVSDSSGDEEERTPMENLLFSIKKPEEKFPNSYLPELAQILEGKIQMRGKADWKIFWQCMGMIGGPNMLEFFHVHELFGMGDLSDTETNQKYLQILLPPLMKNGPEGRWRQESGFRKLNVAMGNLLQSLLVPSVISFGQILRMTVPVAFLVNELVGSHSEVYRKTKVIRDICCTVKPTNLDIVRAIEALLPQYLKGEDAEDKTYLYYLTGESDKLDKWRKSTVLHYSKIFNIYFK